MEKEIVWTSIATSDFWQIVSYLKENWPVKVLNSFSSSLNIKIQLLKTHPKIGFRSSQHSRFRKTLVSKHYLLIYSIAKKHIVIHRIKHSGMIKLRIFFKSMVQIKKASTEALII